MTLEPRRRFPSFLRFLASCDGVVNLTASHVLGRITFLAAALDKPGVFTSNAELNTRLYPGSTVPLLAPAALRDALTGLLAGLVRRELPARFMPDSAATRTTGDFSANARSFAGLFAELPAVGAESPSPRDSTTGSSYLQYGNPAAYPPLERSATQLSNAGWNVLFLGAHTAGVESLTLPPLLTHPHRPAVREPRRVAIEAPLRVVLRVGILAGRAISAALDLRVGRHVDAGRAPAEAGVPRAGRVSRTRRLRCRAPRRRSCGCAWPPAAGCRGSRI